MKLKTISYKRVKNLGNYQSETVEMTIELDPEDNENQAFYILKEKVLKCLELYSSPKPSDESDDFIPF